MLRTRTDGLRLGLRAGAGAGGLRAPPHGRLSLTRSSTRYQIVVTSAAPWMALSRVTRGSCSVVAVATMNLSHGSASGPRGIVVQASTTSTSMACNVSLDDDASRRAQSPPKTGQEGREATRRAGPPDRQAPPFTRRCAPGRSPRRAICSAGMLPSSATTSSLPSAEFAVLMALTLRPPRLRTIVAAVPRRAAGAPRSRRSTAPDWGSCRLVPPRSCNS